MQCQRPVEGPSIAPGLADRQEIPGEPGLRDFQEIPSNGDLQQAPGESPAVDETAQLRHTPRKLLRKAAPKRKRLGSLQAPAQGVQGCSVGSVNVCH